MYRLLWVSGQALHDSSSGAALQCRRLLAELRRLRPDLAIEALCCTCFDHERGQAALPQLKDFRLEAGSEGLLRFEQDCILWHYVVTQERHCLSVRESDTQRFIQQGLRRLRDFRPQLLLGFSDMSGAMVLRGEAWARGIPNACYLGVDAYLRCSFGAVQLLLTNARATAQRYAGHGLNAVPIGTCLDTDSSVAAPAERNPSFVTMVNPSPEKGVAVLAGLARLCLREAPEVRFAVVESRGTLAQALRELHEPDRDRPAGLTPRSLPNVQVLPHTQRMAGVYARTQVLLAPSLWWEAWGRVATEALLNGVSVLCTTSGGLPEAAGVAQGASLALPPPPACAADFRCIPPEEQLQPWLSALRELLSRDRSAACAAAAADMTPRAAAVRTWEALLPLLRRSGSTRPDVPRRGLQYTDAFCGLPPSV